MLSFVTLLTPLAYVFLPLVTKFNVNFTFLCSLNMIIMLFFSFHSLSCLNLKKYTFTPEIISYNHVLTQPRFYARKYWEIMRRPFKQQSNKSIPMQYAPKVVKSV